MTIGLPMGIRRAVLPVLLIFVFGSAVPLAPPAAADSKPASVVVGLGSARYRAPVDAPIVDPFRMDNGPFGAGNRGLEYGTTGGEQVRSTAAGQVYFVGEVVGRLIITLRHGDGRLSSVTNLRTALVEVGQVVLGGEIIGHAGPGLHFGIREDGRYVDPAHLLEVRRRRGSAYLVPPRRSDADNRWIARITWPMSPVVTTGVGSPGAN